MSSRAPLRLGTGDGGLGLEASVDPEHPEIARLRGPTGEPLTLTKRGGAHLAQWLIDWAKPRKLKLWGAGDILREEGIAESTLHNWRKHRDFPKPIETSSGPIWEAQKVRAWAKSRPKRGRPPKKRATRR